MIIPADANRLIEILNNAGVDDLAVIVQTMHGAADMAREQKKSVVSNCFRELELLAVVALRVEKMPGKKPSMRNTQIEVPPGAVVQ